MDIDDLILNDIDLTEYIMDIDDLPQNKENIFRDLRDKLPKEQEDFLNKIKREFFQTIISNFFSQFFISNGKKMEKHIKKGDNSDKLVRFKTDDLVEVSLRYVI